MTDSTPASAFLRAILESPDDDAPRLVFADWLDESGDPERAEFIRLQIRLARLSRDDLERRALGSVVHQIAQAHHVEWVNQLPDLPGVHWEVFDRGFISTVKFDDPDAFFASARKVFVSAPIREVRLHQFFWPEATRLAESPYLNRVRVLDLNDGNRIGNQGLEALMRSPQLSQLTELKVGRNSLGSAGTRAVAESPYVRALQVLKLERNDLFDDGLRYLAASANLSQLQYLDLERTRTGDDGLRAMSRSRTLTRLAWLHLGGNLITDGGIQALAGSDVTAEVRDLFLHSNGIGDQGAAALAQSPAFARVERLFLRHNNIRDEGAIALARSPHLSHLKELQLGENKISDQAGDELRARFRSRVNLY